MLSLWHISWIGCYLLYGNLWPNERESFAGRCAVHVSKLGEPLVNASDVEQDGMVGNEGLRSARSRGKYVHSQRNDNGRIDRPNRSFLATV